MSDSQTELRVILAAIEGGQIMLPGSVVAEVIEFTTPEPLEGAPDWLLGIIRWQDWNVPVLSYAMLGGTAKLESAGGSSRILVVKSLGDASQAPYLGVLISGIPRLAKVTAKDFSDPDPQQDNPFVVEEITFKEERTSIPNLDVLAESCQPFLATD